MLLIIPFQLLLFSQLMILRALGNEWSVKYSQLNLCALKGSTVFMNGTYTQPTRLTVMNRFWLINPVQGKESTDLRNEPGYSDRVKYLGDEQKHFSLRLSDVKKTDEHMYCFRIITNKDKEKFLGFPGVTLTVTELRVETPEKVVEGNKTILVCSTTCSLSDAPAFIWYKNNHTIDTNKNNSNTLTLHPTKADDTGSYNCAVRGYEQLRSPARTLNVRYRPKNVSVSISPSGEIVEGSSVTLTCSSDANPPVENYTWFKGKASVGNEKTYNISKIRTEHSGEYKCKCSNEVGHQDSIGVTLTVADGQNKMLKAVIAVIIACLSSFSLVLTVVLLRKKKKYCWSEERTVKHDNVAAQSAANDAPQSNSHLANQDEVQYASIVHSRKAESSAVRATEQVLYASIQHQRDKVVKNHQEDDVQYATVHFPSSHK
ncbi:B-cell receptor CD22 isoform X2 [Pangasianodon hypophthalmus]|nr:B-cell receptor CD22 isoform X1 [Pangasianodon hypophthalmus]XP_034156152.1 B-cell receptor CD22 isoform X2 [Pangasianodon hypophthalmus]